MGVKLGLAY